MSTDGNSWCKTKKGRICSTTKTEHAINALDYERLEKQISLTILLDLLLALLPDGKLLLLHSKFDADFFQMTLEVSHALRDD